MSTPNAWLINTARGHILDEDALYDAVKDKHLEGAVLDVFKPEPYYPDTKDLRELGNIIMTPHIGSSTAEACRRMAEMALFNIRCCRDGKPEQMHRSRELI